MTPAISSPVHPSMPSRPGDEFTSMTSGPWSDSSISTPATRSPIIWAAFTATFFTSSESSIASVVPPRCTFERNSSPTAVRRIAATTRSPTTKARTSRPLLSAMNCWISTFCRVLCRVSMTASATFLSGARITPMPWVPSSNLITTGAPPTRSIAGRTSPRSRTNVVAGMPTPWLEKSWVDRNLSREFAIPVEVFGVYTLICSNWRTTARPKNVIDVPIRSSTAS